jgi:hypothetical protein
MRVVLAALLCLLAALAQVSPEHEKQLFSRVDGMLASVSEITGMKVLRPVPRALITREKIREYIEKRIAEAVKPEEIRGQELLLKKLGFVGADFDLKAQTVDLLTEQAAAFYDFKQKKLFLATWTPSAMQDVALVHELAHALADQHFNLQKFVEKSGEDDDAATARGAVVEGQASWVMTEYMLKQAGRSLKESPELARGPADAVAEAAKAFPVFGAAPLYLQETLLFPYTRGLPFQQAVLDKLGRDGFAEVFRRPPVSSQQIVHPELYFQKVVPSKPSLRAAALPKGYKKILEGTLGELDHQILLRQFIGAEEANKLAPRWRGSRYALWESAPKDRTVLYYVAEWEREADAASYFAHYRTIGGKKWKRLEASKDQPEEVAGVGDDGRFQWTLKGKVFTSVEGLP